VGALSRAGAARRGRAWRAWTWALVSLGWLGGWQPAAAALPMEVQTLGLSSSDEALVAAPPAGASALQKRRVRGLMRSLAASAPWKAEVLSRTWGAALSELPVDPQDPNQPDDPNRQAMAKLREMTIRLAKDGRGCAPLRRSLDQFVKDIDAGRQPAPPITAAQASASRGDCADGQIAARNQVFLTIPARPNQTVALLVLGPTFRMISELPHFSGVAAGRWTLFFAAVPVDARVLVIVRPEGSPASAGAVPAVPYVQPLSAHEDNYVTPEKPSCLDLSRLSTDPGATLFVNGTAIPPDTDTVELLQPGSGATVQVFEAGPPGSGQRKQVFTRELAAARMAGALSCTLVEGDATASSKKMVLVAVTTGGTSCAEEGVDPQKIRAQIEDLLPESRYETRGANVTDVLKTVSEVQSILTSLGAGGTAGQPAEPAADPTADVARGLRDVGFSVALTVDVRCIRPAGGDVQFTVVGQRIDLDALTRAARQESRKQRMDSMSRVLTSQIETQIGAQTLRGLLLATVGRLFRLPYLRLTNGSTADWQRADVRLNIEALIPGQPKETRRAEMQARKIVEAAERVECGNVNDLNAVRTAGAAKAPVEDKPHWTEGHDVALAASHFPGPAAADAGDPEAAPMAGTAFTLPFFPVEPGQYAIRIRLLDGAEKPVSELNVCATIEEAAYVLWSELDHFENVARIGRLWPGVSMTTSYLLVGAQRHTSETYSLGAMVGFGYSFYQASGPPDWSGVAHAAQAGDPAARLGAVMFNQDGSLPLSWTRVSIAGALQFERRMLRLADLVPDYFRLAGWWRGLIQRSPLRASAFYLSLMPLIDLGWYTTGGIPGGLGELKGSTAYPFDVDGSLILGLAYKVGLTDHQLLSVGAQVGWLGFDDLGNADPRRRGRITYDDWLAWGLTVGFGWAP
jgi:hypothetical protein